MRWFVAGLLLVCSLSTARSSPHPAPGDVFHRSAKSKYCPDIGWFDDAQPFDGLPLPDCPEDLDISKLLYTRSTTGTGQQVTRSTIPKAFDGTKLTIFIVHGWMSDGETKWVTNMTKAFLLKGDYNVIVIDWDSRRLKYRQSASDTRSVGAEIGLVAANLIAKGNSAKSRLYCVGHSLGAHVCGHAGMRTKFGRITGLDPAGPKFESRDWTAGLNPNSADLVDVIHTNVRLLGIAPLIPTLGTKRVLGHIDFYPNGGDVQPGCLVPGCSHGRAHQYYLESISSPCFSSRQQCTDERKLPASCTTNPSVIQSMGFEADKYNARGIFYLTTNGRSPYCRG